MRLRQVVGVALVSAATVVGVDLLVNSSLLHLLRPRILSPADGAIVTGSVTVSWEGPEPMRATLTGSGQRFDLGLRHSPFEIDASRFPRPGQYGIELSATRLGGMVRVDRRFLVRRPAGRTLAGAAAAPEALAPAAPAPEAQSSTLSAEIAALVREREQLRVELAAVQGELTTLRADQAVVAEALEAEQNELEARLAAVAQQRDTLIREHAQALQENQALRWRLSSIPSCTAWGYVAVVRPQNMPPSRLVVASNFRGEVFRSEQQCAAARRGDPHGVSACACVGAVPDG